MLRRIMAIPDTLRSLLPSFGQFGRLMEIGWQDVGGIVLAISGITAMSVMQRFRSR
jgi:hypothetical protein